MSWQLLHKYTLIYMFLMLHQPEHDIVPDCLILAVTDHQENDPLRIEDTHKSDGRLNAARRIISHSLPVCSVTSVYRVNSVYQCEQSVQCVQCVPVYTVCTVCTCVYLCVLSTVCTCVQCVPVCILYSVYLCTSVQCVPVCTVCAVCSVYSVYSVYLCVVSTVCTCGHSVCSVNLRVVCVQWVQCVPVCSVCVQCVQCLPVCSVYLCVVCVVCTCAAAVFPAGVCCQQRAEPGESCLSVCPAAAGKPSSWILWLRAERGFNINPVLISVELRLYSSSFAGSLKSKYLGSVLRSSLCQSCLKVLNYN